MTDEQKHAPIVFKRGELSYELSRSHLDGGGHPESGDSGPEWDVETADSEDLIAALLANPELRLWVLEKMPEHVATVRCLEAVPTQPDGEPEPCGKPMPCQKHAPQPPGEGAERVTHADARFALTRFKYAEPHQYDHGLLWSYVNQQELAESLAAERVRDLLSKAYEECVLAKREGRPMPEYLPIRRAANPTPAPASAGKLGEPADRLRADLIAALLQIVGTDPHSAALVTFGQLHRLADELAKGSK